MPLIDPAGIMPGGLIDKSKRTDALTWIRTQPNGSSFRRGLARGWAARVGVRLSAAEYDFVDQGSVPGSWVDGVFQPSKG
jgi:hypothetical protein